MKSKKGQAIIEMTVASMVMFFMFTLMVKGFYWMYKEMDKKYDKAVVILYKIEKMYDEIKK